MVTSNQRPADVFPFYVEMVDFNCSCGSKFNRKSKENQASIEWDERSFPCQATNQSRHHLTSLQLSSNSLNETTWQQLCFSIQCRFICFILTHLFDTLQQSMSIICKFHGDNNTIIKFCCKFCETCMLNPPALCLSTHHSTKVLLH